MKTTYYLLTISFILFGYTANIYSQAVSVSDKSDQQPHESALLDLISDEKGFLMTRINGNEQINDPAESLIIFNTQTYCFEIHLEGVWYEIWCHGECVESTIPSEITGDEEVCESEAAELTVQGGMLGTGAHWMWYSEGCGEDDGGVFVDDGTTIFAYPSTATTYYVRAEGDCGITDCVSFEVGIIDVPDAPTEGSHVAGIEVIQWNWNEVDEADGYKWHTDDDYDNATDVNSNNFYLESGLDCETSYTRYVWAYNECGPSEVLVLNFETEDCLPESEACDEADRPTMDGYEYEIVGIGDQCWFAENLRTTVYADGTPIPHNLSDVEWNATEEGAYAIYDYNQVDGIDSEEQMVEVFGKLYNWHTNEETGGICPDGWSVPSNDDFQILRAYLANNAYYCVPSEGGNIYWITQSLSAKSWWQENDEYECSPGYDLLSNNLTGFSALPAGERNQNGVYINAIANGMFWTSTEHETNDTAGTSRSINAAGQLLWTWFDNKNSGRSIRCLMDSK